MQVPIFGSICVKIGGVNRVIMNHFRNYPTPTTMAGPWYQKKEKNDGYGD